MSAERFPIRRLIADNVAPHTLVARMGMEDIVEDLMMRAYRTGLHNGKIIGKRRTTKSRPVGYMGDVNGPGCDPDTL